MQPYPLSRRKFLAFSGTAALTGLASPLVGVANEPPAQKQSQTEIGTAINEFAVDLFRRLTGPNSKEQGNLFISPFSLETALAMTSAGARGKTLEEMEKVLHLPKDPHPAFGELIGRLNSTGLDKLRPYELSIANAIWVQHNYPWNKEFLDLTRKHYEAGAIGVNFVESEAARKQINTWVEKQTKEKIKDLIAPDIITALTRMVLVNAIYFKSKWLHPFNKKLTKEAPFTRADGTKVDVPLMSHQATFNYVETHIGGRTGLQVQVLELPYAGKELSMLVFLPQNGNELDRLPPRLPAQTLANPQLTPTDVRVFLPRFKMDKLVSLKPVLMDMGMKLAFTSADFTGMSPRGKELYITHVLHKVFVDVNEEGTEATGATAVVVGRDAKPPEPKVFRADRPFVFAIRDNTTGAALFLGRYVGPT